MICGSHQIRLPRHERHSYRFVPTAIGLALFLLTALPGLAQEKPGRAASRRPNVILIYSDDQGSVDVNCYGAKDLITPNLDRLAQQGVRFTQMYAPAPICSSSRAGLLTGRFPVRAGVPSNVSSTKGHAGMPAEEVTIAEVLREAGYATGHVGKWHLGYTPETMPLGQGFDFSFGHMGGCIDNYSHFFYWNGPNRHDLWRDGREVWADGQFFPDLMVRECHRFLESNKQQPFFLYWAINVPHYPLQGTDRWRNAYRELPSPRYKYAAFVSTMDECIGQVLNKVEQLGLRDSTLVIFQSDHGHSTEERTFGGGGSAGEYRGAKASLFEGGIRVPAIVALPGRIPAGEVRHQLATGCDWLPTICKLCDVPLPKHKLDGKSLAGVLASDSAASPHDMFYWYFGRGPGAQRAIRQGDWKLLVNARDTTERKPDEPAPKVDKVFLVNLADDIRERNNLAAKHPEVVTRLMQVQVEVLGEMGLE